MRKQLKNIIILLVALALIIGAYFALEKFGPKAKEEKKEDSKVEKIVDIGTKKITEISIENKDIKFSCIKKGDAWSEDTEGKKVDSAIVEKFVTTITGLTIGSVVEENAKDLSIFGLDKSIKVNAKVDDGSVINIEIGSKAPAEGGYYAKLKDKNKVFTIGAYDAEQFLIDNNTFRPKTIFEGKADEVNYYELERDGKIVISGSKKDNLWNMALPIAHTADLTIMAEMVNNSFGLTIDKYIEDNASDLAKYGLDKPKYAFEIGIGDKKKKVFIGEEKERGVTNYAKLADSKDVFTINMISLTFLDKPTLEIYEKLVFCPNIKEISKIELKIDDKTYVSNVVTDKDDKTKDQFKFNDVDLKKKDSDKGDSLFRKYYQALIAIKLSEIEPDAKPSGDPLITINYTFNNGNTNKIELIKKNDNKFYYMKDGKYLGIVTDIKDIDNQSDGLKLAIKGLEDYIK